MSITYGVAHGISRFGERLGVKEMDKVDVRADYLAMDRMHVSAEVLHRFKNLKRVQFLACTFDDFAWPETITYVSLASCILDVLSSFPGASVTTLQFHFCTSSDWDLVMDRVARSNVNDMRFAGISGREQVVDMLPRSNITKFEFRDFFVKDEIVRALVRVAETCDIVRIAFESFRVHDIDLRRTRELVEFGHINSYTSPHVYVYQSELDAAIAARRVLAVLSARTGPALRFLKRDGDHACMARVFRML